MIGVRAKRFELRGEFAGFIRNEAGKRRMVVRDGAEEWRLKVPKDLRRQLAAHLGPGCRIAVAGVEQCDEWSGAVRRVASQVQLLSAPKPSLPHPCTTCTIRVCAKKNCWNDGGKALWSALQKEIDARGLADAVKLKAVGCLGNCDHAPNAAVRDHDYERCGASSARAIVSRAAASLEPSLSRAT